MVPDIKLKDYYYSYVYDAQNDIELYDEQLKCILADRKEIKLYINNHIEILQNDYGINLNKYEDEWINEIYNNKKSLYKLIIKSLQDYDEAKHRGILIQLLKYCKSLEEENKINNLKDLASIRSDISFAEYKKYISSFYTNVQRCVLEGNGYVFDNGIGTFIINYWKLDKSFAKPIIDFAATNKLKRQILSEGKKLYDEDEARLYAERGIPYDGVRYKVYRKDGNIYEITFIDSKIFNNKELDFQKTEYVHAKYRGMSYQEIADKDVKDFNDILMLNVDLKYKLNILLYLEPSNYLKYVRNAEQRKYIY